MSFTTWIRARIGRRKFYPPDSTDRRLLWIGIASVLGSPLDEPVVRRFLLVTCLERFGRYYRSMGNSFSSFKRKAQMKRPTIHLPYLT
jgi:hypothetical protein